MAKKTKKFMKTIAEMFGKKNCNISATCLAVGISRKTFDRWRNEDEDFRDMLDESQEALYDWWESQAIKKGLDGDSSMIQFVLRTKCGNRGYDPAQKIALSGTVKAELSDNDIRQAITEFSNLLKVSGIEPTEENINKEISKLKNDEKI